MPMTQYTTFSPFTGIIWVLFWVILALVISRFTWGHRQCRRGWPEKTALDILKERYAKGEIDKQEFEEKKKDLV